MFPEIIESDNCCQKWSDLKKCFVDAVFQHFLLCVNHYLHTKCPACRRTGRLRLRSLAHTCSGYDHKLVNAYKDFGKRQLLLFSHEIWSFDFVEESFWVLSHNQFQNYPDYIRRYWPFGSPLSKALKNQEFQFLFNQKLLLENSKFVVL